MDSVLNSTWLNRIEGQFLFVVMVTGSVGCGKNTSLAKRLDQDPEARHAIAPLLHFERGNTGCGANV